MNPVEMKMFMDMYGYPFGVSLSPFEFPRYPPSAIGPTNTNPAKLKEKMIKENSTFSARLYDFNRLYLRHASGLLDMSSNAFPPGHPLSHGKADYLLQDENMKLQKENSDLKKIIEQMTKTKKQF
jgi:hypothetical protein